MILDIKLNGDFTFAQMLLYRTPIVVSTATAFLDDESTAPCTVLYYRAFLLLFHPFIHF